MRVLYRSVMEVWGKEHFAAQIKRLIRSQTRLCFDASFTPTHPRSVYACTQMSAFGCRCVALLASLAECGYYIAQAMHVLPWLTGEISPSCAAQTHDNPHQRFSKRPRKPVSLAPAAVLGASGAAAVVGAAALAAGTTAGAVGASGKLRGGRGL